MREVVQDLVDVIATPSSLTHGPDGANDSRYCLAGTAFAYPLQTAVRWLRYPVRGVVG